jgi:1-aminocyclopropane-1-carboxylate deaminase/D-cysteine desulfhydrase-like pyridoxal-dependent ACC family enzyme
MAGRREVPGGDLLVQGLERVPRQRLALLPTPLLEAPRLSVAIDGPKIWMKREDLAGWGLGGSKYRILEFSLGYAVAQGADVVVAAGLTRSNHPQQVVSAASHLGIPAVVILSNVDDELAWTGNLLLQGLSDAEIHIVPPTDFVGLQKAQDEMLDRLRRKGRRPVAVTLTREVHLCSVFAYANYIVELAGQMKTQGIEPNALYVGSGGPTYAGLLLGKLAMGLSFDVIGVTPRRPASERISHVAGLIHEASGRLDLTCDLPSESIHITEAYVGKGYGFTTAAAVDAIRLVAATEGVFLDPLYTGKAMSGLIDHVRKGEIHRSDVVVFAHTGGTPNLFAYADQLIPENLRPARVIHGMGLPST